MTRIDIDTADVDETTRNLIREVRSEIDTLFYELEKLKEATPELTTDLDVLNAQQAQIEYVLAGNNTQERWQKITNAIRDLT